MTEKIKGNSINLDKSLALTRHIMNEEVALSDAFIVNKFCGEKISFNFSHVAGCCPSMPIEHIGLAQLVYQKAVDQFYTTKVNGNGTEERVFEPLPQGQTVSSILESCNPDLLAWYGDKSTLEPLRLVTLKDGTVLHQDISKYQKSINFNYGEPRPFFDSASSAPRNIFDERCAVVSEALCEAICTYEDELIGLGYAEEKGVLTEIALAESKALSEGLKNLKSQTIAKYGQVEDESMTYAGTPDAEDLFVGVDEYAQ